METWLIIIVSLSIAAVIKSIQVRRRGDKKLPPGPPFLTTIFLLLTNPPIKFKPVLLNLKAQYGPIFALSFGLAPNIFVSDRSLAHQILVQKGAVSSDRPKSIITRTISTTSYGHPWRILRRNLAIEIMHPTRVRSYSCVRKWVLGILIDRLQDRRESDGVKVVDHFRYAMFSLLVVMCFGEKVDESKINELARIQRNQLLSFASGRFAVLTLFPNLGKLLFRNRWKEYEKSRSDRDDVIVPLIKSRVRSANLEAGLGEKNIVAYVDTLVNLQYPREENNNSSSSNNSIRNSKSNSNSNNNNNNNNNNGKRLTDSEIASLCSEFLNAGIDTTTTALHWIMANIVKHPHIQSKLYDEIVEVVGPPPPPPQKGVELESESVINEEDLQKMPYLKAVVLEGLRRHSPVHMLLPHMVMKEVNVQGYTIPQGATVNFMVSEMGLDPNVWDEPMEFKPERFLVHDGVFDISGKKGITMMPFGAGRRICPGADLALLHLEYFIANLIWYFNWTVPDGCEVDLSEKTEFGVVMKNPLTAQLSSRA